MLLSFVALPRLFRVLGYLAGFGWGGMGFFVLDFGLGSYSITAISYELDSSASDSSLFLTAFFTGGLGTV